MTVTPENLVPNNENEGRFQSLMEASLDPLVTISLDGRIMDFNEALANITGVIRENLTGSDFFGYFIEPHLAREIYQQVFAEGSVTDSPLTIRHSPALPTT